MNSHFRFMLSMLSREGHEVARVPVEPDWLPALECATFEGVRAGRLRARAKLPTGLIEPVWNDALGQPYLAAFEAMVTGEDGEPVSARIPVEYVRPLAQQASLPLVEQGRLEAGESFRYVVCAFPVAPEEERDGPRTGPGDGDALPIGETALQPFLDASVHSGQGNGNDVPVFVSRHLLDEAFELARGAGDVETGGVLIGKLHFDPGLPEFFVEVTALIPAPHGVSTSTRFTFTPETWAAVDAAVRLRGGGESKIGWLHTHPDWCRKCEPQKRRECKLTNAFFSADDALLHRTCFSRAFHTAMLISDNTLRGLSVSFFGWRAGMVAARGFHVLRASPGMP